MENEQYIKMTETPVSKLIITLGIPTTISMLITNIYNMADTFFVSKISVTASGATGIVFALMAIFQAFGFMFGHGAGSNISRLLGARRDKEAIKYASTSFFLAALVGLIICVLGLVFLDPLMYFLGSTDTILNDAKTYAFFILISGPALTTSCVLNNILRYEGRATFAMFGLTAGGILNMCMDPILIFVFHMNIAGAGLSTAISQYISLIILFIPYTKNVTVTKIHFKDISYDFSVIEKIVRNGLPSLCRQGLTSLSTTFLNNSAGIYGDEAIAAMSVVARCGNMLFSFALGLAQGFQPVSAFNYGAAKFNRVKKGCYFTIAFGVAIMMVLCTGCYFNADTIIRLFRSEPEIVSIGSDALRWLCSLLWLLPVSAVGSMLFQSIGKSGRAMILACLQSGLLYIPLIVILPTFMGLSGIEAAQPIAYTIAALINVPFIYFFLKQY